MGLTFERDETKARANAAKHGVTFERGQHHFRRLAVADDSDPDHSMTEERQITIGMSHKANILVVVHTERGDNIRVISARRANRRERQAYAESR